MLDIVYVLGVIAVFVLVAGIGKAVEKLVIVLELLAVALGAAAIVYLVVALVRPERF